jgi:hypothetical protein
MNSSVVIGRDDRGVMTGIAWTRPMPPDGFLENRRQPKRTQGQAASINAAMGNFRLPIAALPGDAVLDGLIGYHHQRRYPQPQ